jgi:hypothetical protein
MSISFVPEDTEYPGSLPGSRLTLGLPFILDVHQAPAGCTLTLRGKFS